MHAFDRVKLLIGKDGYNKLEKASVILFGVGGVGGFCAEALARSGIGKITLIDNDSVSITNINRQIIATVDSVGRQKVEVLKDRLKAINPSLIVDTRCVFYLKENGDSVDFEGADYVIDAVDTVSAKIEIIERAKRFNIPVISCMGTGGKLDITKLQVGDISVTQGCPLARVMRRELKKRNVKDVKVVYSTEKVSIKDDETDLMESKGNSGRVAPPSMIFVPASAGLMLAKEVVFDIIKKGDKQ